MTPPYLIEIHSSSGCFIYRFRGDQIRDVCGIVQRQWQSGLLRGLAFRAVCHELENVIDLEAWEEKRRQRVREVGRSVISKAWSRLVWEWRFLVWFVRPFTNPPALPEFPGAFSKEL